MTKILKISRYFEEIWQLKEVQPPLLDALIGKDCLIEIVNGQPPYSIVIGVPHQAAVRETKISENSPEGPRNSDEGAAFYALVAFSALKDWGIPCKLVIAAHDTLYDPNKDAGSPYWQAIFSAEMRLLFECHGAKDERKVDLEISSGRNSLGKPVEFGKGLAKELDYRYTLIAQASAGTKNGLRITRDGETPTEIENPANKTNSLIEADKHKIPALHLEARPPFRIPADGSNTVTPDGLILGRAIARALEIYLE